MIWYITIATVFLFQNGHVMCNENASSVRDIFDIELGDVQYMVTVNRLLETGDYKFLCHGVSIDPYFVLTVSTCVNKLDDDNPMVLRARNVSGGNFRLSNVIAIYFHPETSRLNRNIALLRTHSILTEESHVVSLPETVFAPIPGSNIDIICYTLNHTAHGDSIGDLRILRTNIVDIEAVRNLPKFSFLAENPGNLLAMDEVGCPAFSQGILVGLASYVQLTQPAVFTDIFRLEEFILKI